MENVTKFQHSKPLQKEKWLSMNWKIDVLIYIEIGVEIIHISTHQTLLKNLSYLISKKYVILKNVSKQADKSENTAKNIYFIVINEDLGNL